MQVQLYIGSERVDFFKDEPLSVNDSIQNVRDISKVFTVFSQQFSVPASAKNNKTLNHYYNNDIVNGYDARLKVTAEIRLNGVTYKTGKIRLNGVTMKDGQPYSYTLVFFGDIVALTDIFGQDDLTILSANLAKYNHTYSQAIVVSGLKTGLALSGGVMIESAVRDIIYPLNSHTRRYIYNNTGGIPTTDTLANLYRSVNTYGAVYTDFKPAIKCGHIITAIEEKYGITFDKTDFFNSADFLKLYLLLNRNKGIMVGGGSLQSKTIYLSDFDGITPSPSYSSITSYNTSNYVETFNLNYTITPLPNTKKYNVIIRDEITGATLGSWSNQIGNKDFSIFLSEDGVTYNPSITITTSDGVTSFGISLQVTHTTESNGEEPIIEVIDYTSSSSPYNILSTIVIGEQLPKMTVIDFVTSIFKMFNLTAYYEDGIIKIKTLDNYYTSTQREIDDYVDISTVQVSRSFPYSSLELKKQEAQTFLANKFKELNNKEFGSLSYTAGDNFDGPAYNVNVEFETMMYERLVGVNTGVATGISYGWFVDDKQEPTLPKPIIFFNVNTTTAEKIAINNLSGSGLSTYNRMANCDINSLHFGSEIDEFTYAQNNNSLFKIYYKTYIEGVYKRSARLIKLTAILPLAFILNYKLSDLIIYKNHTYRINTINIDLTTGKAQIEIL